MSDDSELGVVYTDHCGLTAMSPIASLWSYQTRVRGHSRHVALNVDGSRDYWLHQSDPLLNTILPGTHVSLIFNFGDMWASGASLPACSSVPRVCVVGPFTKAQILRVGRSVRAIGTVIAPSLAFDVIGVPASALVDRIVSLDDIWNKDDVERLGASLVALDNRTALAALKRELVGRIGQPDGRELAHAAPQVIRAHGGSLSIEDVARKHGLTRHQFNRRFQAAAGLPPKLFARITRFQRLVHVLLSTDVARWAAISSGIGFYDQAHMINEFRAFAGAPPTIFFQPHGEVEPSQIHVHGRPSEWVRRNGDTQLVALSDSHSKS
jgi:AraC-like DNA-binding protein